jgi:hypothetical protein
MLSLVRIPGSRSWGILTRYSGGFTGVLPTPPELSPPMVAIVAALDPTSGAA